MNNCPGHFMESFLCPESVAAIGASNNPRSINHALVANLIQLVPFLSTD